MLSSKPLSKICHRSNVLQIVLVLLNSLFWSSDTLCIWTGLMSFSFLLLNELMEYKRELQLTYILPTLVSKSESIPLPECHISLSSQDHFSTCNRSSSCLLNPSSLLCLCTPSPELPSVRIVSCMSCIFPSYSVAFTSPDSLLILFPSTLLSALPSAGVLDSSSNTKLFPHY